MQARLVATVVLPLPSFDAAHSENHEVILKLK